MKAINLHAGPGTGKSTTAAGLFALMKHEGYKVELVTEYAKELCYEGTLAGADQIDIFVEQWRRMRRLEGQVDYVITDSPLMFSLIYHEPKSGEGWYRDAVLHAYNQFDNFNVFLRRVKPYQAFGRLQDEDGARELDERIHSMPLIAWDYEVDGDRHAAQRILAKIEGREPPQGLPAHLIDAGQGPRSCA